MPFIPGATTIGLTFKNGVILASERRVSYGHFVMSKTGKKVFRITDKVGAACAGLIGDMQNLVREAAAYTNLYTLEVGRGATVRTTAKIMGSLLMHRRLFPYLTQTIVAGVENDEHSKLFVLDPLGSVIEDQYTAIGTGAEIAIGVLEAEYNEELDEKKALSIIKKAMKSATARDAGSGDDIDILIITQREVKELTVQKDQQY